MPSSDEGVIETLQHEIQDLDDRVYVLENEIPPVEVSAVLEVSFRTVWREIARLQEQVGRLAEVIEKVRK